MCVRVPVCLRVITKCIIMYGEVHHLVKRDEAIPASSLPEGCSSSPLRGQPNPSKGYKPTHSGRVVAQLLWIHHRLLMMFYHGPLVIMDYSDEVILSLAISSKDASAAWMIYN